MCEVEAIVTIAIDILNQLADFNSAILRDHILKQNDMDEVWERGFYTVICVFLLQDNQFLNILISLLVDSQYSSEMSQMLLII